MDGRNGMPLLTRKDSTPEPSGNSSRKRLRPEDEAELDPHLPSNDRNNWYYPGVSRENDGEDDDLPAGTANGNWGKKNRHNARFVRRGHIAAWGPTREEYDIEERSRKRLRMILPEFTGEPIEQDPILPHLRSPSPPMIAPYSPSPIHHTSYTASVFDPNVGASFRSNLFNSLERSASELIQSEIALTRALGRFWTALTESANTMAREQRHAITEENRKDLTEQMSRMEMDSAETGDTRVNGTKESSSSAQAAAFAPIPDQDLAKLDNITTQNVMLQLFTLPGNMKFDYQGMQNGGVETISLAPMHQVELVTRSVIAVRELQEDSKECMERLEEIREMLGKVRGLRDAVWAIMRSRAIAEMESDE